MSASNRSLARLPYSIFSNLVLVPVCDDERDNNINNNKGHDDDDDNCYEAVTSLKNAICSKLKDSNITTVGELLRVTPPTLLSILDLTNEECQELVYRICCTVATIPKSAKELLLDTTQQNENVTKNHQQQYSSSQHTHMHYIPSNLPELDTILRGGIRLNSITEIVGCAGVGKTQFVMQLAIVASTYNMGCIYIDTECKLSLLRLKEMAIERYNSNHSMCNNNINKGNDDGSFPFQYYTYYDDGQQQQGNKDNGNNSNQQDINGHRNDGHNTSSNVEYKPPQDVLNNVTIHSPKSTKDLISVISKLQHYIVEKTYYRHDNNNNYDTAFPIKLIILDSIAAPTRRDFGSEEARERVSSIFKIAQMLKQVACEMNVAIVVINQIDNVLALPSSATATTRTTSSTLNNNHNLIIPSVKASLGTSWHHCVSTRILLEHDNVDEHNDQKIVSSTAIFNRVRKATVVKSPLVSCASTNFEITGVGICQL